MARICSKPEDRERRFADLKAFLLARDYKASMVDAAIGRARKIPRTEALKRVERSKNKRPVLVLTYHPALPGVSAIMARHWRTMTRDPL